LCDDYSKISFNVEKEKRDIETLGYIPVNKEISSNHVENEHPVVAADILQRELSLKSYYPNTRSLQIPKSISTVHSLSTIAEASVEKDRTYSYFTTVNKNDDGFICVTPAF